MVRISILNFVPQQPFQGDIMSRIVRVVLGVVILVFSVMVIVTFVHDKGVDFGEMIRSYDLKMRQSIDIDKDSLPALPSVPNRLDILDVYKI